MSAWCLSVSVQYPTCLRLSLSFNICCLESDDVYLDWARVLSCQYLSSEFNQCLPRSVSQFLSPICSEGITWCLPGSTQHLFCQCLFNGFDQHLSELVLMYLFLSLPVVRNLLMSIWTELACLLASIFLVSSISVCLEVSPNVFCQSVWRGHLMSSWINPISFLPVSVQWVWSVSVRAGSHLSLSANVCYEEPADVYLDWTRVSSCQYLSSEFNRCLPRSVSQRLLPICLKGSLDVFLDQPNVFLVCVC